MPACLSIQLDLGIPAALKGQNVTESQTWNGHPPCHSDIVQLGWLAGGKFQLGWLAGGIFSWNPTGVGFLPAAQAYTPTSLLRT